MEPPVYKPYYWGLDTVFNAKMKLRISDIFSLKKYPGFQDVYCILNHPISAVHIMGDVVSVAKKAQLIRYEVDDTTGVLLCCQWRKQRDSDDGLFIPKLGQLVSIFGRVSEFRNQMQLTIMTIFPEEDPNIEPLHWMEVALLKKTVYSKPFVVPLSILQSSEGATSESDGKSSKSVIKSTIMTHCGAKNRFTLTELRRDDQLLRNCVDKVKTECGLEDEGRIREEFLGIVSNLLPEGDIIPDTQPSPRETEYKVFSMDKHLCPAILSYIKRRQENPNSRCAKLGLQEDWIIEHIKLKETFRHLPTSRITKAIERLVERSEIYPVANRVYSYLK